MGTCLTTHGLTEEHCCDFDDDAFWKSPLLPCIKSADELKVPVEVLNELGYETLEAGEARNSTASASSGADQVSPPKSIAGSPIAQSEKSMKPTCPV